MKELNIFSTMEQEIKSITLIIYPKDLLPVSNTLIELAMDVILHAKLVLICFPILVCLVPLLLTTKQWQILANLPAQTILFKMIKQVFVSHAMKDVPFVPLLLNLIVKDVQLDTFMITGICVYKLALMVIGATIQ